MCVLVYVRLVMVVGIALSVVAALNLIGPASVAMHEAGFTAGGSVAAFVLVVWVLLYALPRLR